MKLEEVLPALRAGKKIRRADWEKTEYIEKLSWYIQTIRGGKKVPCRVEFYSCDIFAEDWEVCE
jgi:hypothetical protein